MATNPAPVASRAHAPHPPKHASAPGPEGWPRRTARKIRRFVDAPLTNLAKGAALFSIGLSEASDSLVEDLTTGQLRVGHGLILVGLFAIFGTIPHFLEGLEAGGRYLEERVGEATPGVEPGAD